MDSPVGQGAALVILIAAALWLIGIAFVMALRPARGLAMLRQTASSHRVNLTEQGMRMVAGVAAIVRAPLSDWPDGFTLAGWFIVLSSAVLMGIPLRWHAGYAIWWADRVSHRAVRGIAPLSLMAGIGVLLSTP